MIFLLMLGQAHAACQARTTSAELDGAIHAAEAAYAAMDSTSFGAATAQADAMLPCLSDLLAPVDVAAYHRMVALEAYAAKDNARTMSAFTAATAVQPAFVLPAMIAPSGNPLDSIYQMAKIQPPGATEVLAPPAGTLAYVDGVRSSQRPIKREAVIQLASTSGEVLWSAVVDAEAPPPDWSAFGQPVAEAEAMPVSESAARKGRPTLPLALGAGGLAIGSGALYAVALGSRAKFDDPSTPIESIEGLRTTTNTEVFGSAGAGVLAIALGALAAVSVTW